MRRGFQAELDFRSCEELSRRRLRVRNPARWREEAPDRGLALMLYEEYVSLSATPGGRMGELRYPGK